MRRGCVGVFPQRRRQRKVKRRVTHREEVEDDRRNIVRSLKTCGAASISCFCALIKFHWWSIVGGNVSSTHIWSKFSPFWHQFLLCRTWSNHLLTWRLPHPQVQIPMWDLMICRQLSTSPSLFRSDRFVHRSILIGEAERSNENADLICRTGFATAAHSDSEFEIRSTHEVNARPPYGLTSLLEWCQRLVSLRH